MDFVAIVLFLATYYLRPQEWSTALSALHPVTLIMGLAMVALFLRDQGLRWRTLFQTPHDWLMLVYFLYIAFFVPSDDVSYATLRNLFIIYFVIVQALTNLERIRAYLYWWAAFIFIVAALAIASEFGFDPLGSAYYTHYVARGRLLLNLTIFNNPNALGHSIVPLLAMLYFFLMWKRPVFMKEVAIALAIPLLWCLYMTQSKGAFVAGFVAILAGLMVGRPKYVQLIVLVLAVTVGWAGMKKLPRMEDLRNPRKEEGIQGRLLAWEFGYNKMLERKYGIGLFQFGFAFEKKNGYFKPAHSSYVEVAAEQGYYGLVLFIGLLYTCFRTLLASKVTDPEEERLRRVLLVIVVSYVISSWLIGWGYRATFFVMVACVAAFHRHLHRKILQEIELMEELEAEKLATQAPSKGFFQPAHMLPLPGAVPLLQVAPAAGPSLQALSVSPAPKVKEDDSEKDKPKPKFWYRLGLMDIGLIVAATMLTEQFWLYIIKRF